MRAHARRMHTQNKIALGMIVPLRTCISQICQEFKDVRGIEWSSCTSTKERKSSCNMGRALTFSVILTFAPPASNTFTTAACPSLLAKWSGAVPICTVNTRRHTLLEHGQGPCKKDHKILGQGQHTQARLPVNFS